MEWLLDVSWERVFVPAVAILEIVVRGSIIYLGVFAILRFVFKRQAGTLGITDLLVVVLIADASQNAMAVDHRSIPDGLTLVATIVGWAFVLDWASYRFPRLQGLVKPPPLLLVRDGQALAQHLEKELITATELLSFLRLHGIDDLELVKKAFLEPNGQISVIRKDLGESEPVERRVT